MTYMPIPTARLHNPEEAKKVSEAVFAKLREIKLDAPHLRLGQIISHANDMLDSGGCLPQELFYTEDERLLEALNIYQANMRF